MCSVYENVCGVCACVCIVYVSMYVCMECVWNVCECVCIVCVRMCACSVSVEYVYSMCVMCVCVVCVECECEHVNVCV